MFQQTQPVVVGGPNCKIELSRCLKSLWLAWSLHFRHFAMPVETSQEPQAAGDWVKLMIRNVVAVFMTVVIAIIMKAIIIEAGILVVAIGTSCNNSNSYNSNNNDIAVVVKVIIEIVAIVIVEVIIRSSSNSHDSNCNNKILIITII